MKGLLKGMVLGSVVGAAASVTALSCCDPRIGRMLVRRGRCAVKMIGKKMTSGFGLM